MEMSENKTSRKENKKNKWKIAQKSINIFTLAKCRVNLVSDWKALPSKKFSVNIFIFFSTYIYVCQSSKIIFHLAYSHNCLIDGI